MRCIKCNYLDMEGPVCTYCLTNSAIGRRWQKRLKERYNITPYDVYDVLQYQDYQCYICEVKFNYIQIALDHNHITGKFRGVLCFKCNLKEGNQIRCPQNLKIFTPEQLIRLHDYWEYPIMDRIEYLRNEGIFKPIIKRETQSVAPKSPQSPDALAGMRARKPSTASDRAY